MKEKKKTEVATNMSSGAEKVETVKEQVKRDKDNTEKKTKTVAVKTASENAAAKARVNAALKKEEAKEKAERMNAERQKQAEKRKADRIARAEKRAAARKARAEKLKAEEEELLRELAHRKAERMRHKKTRAKSENNRNHGAEKRRSEKENRGERRKSYGGWLAAVVTLGAINLALTTAVTIGAVQMKRDNDTAMSGHRSTVYEIMSVMENVENDLDRARVANTAAQQDRILTDLLVQARLAELDFEKLPIGIENDRNVTTFINRVASESEKMLAKLRHGEKLSKEDEATLQRLYEKNHQIREQMSGFMEKMTNKDLMSYIKRGEGMIKEAVDGLEKLTMEENRIQLNDKKEGAGTQRNAPKAESGTSPKINPAKAEELCKQYFSSYKIEDFQCVGETVTRDMGAYNVQGYDDKGTMLFAEIDWQDGKLLRFDYHEDCNDENFDFANAKIIAESFVEGLGYQNMLAVRASENGANSDFTFVYELDGTRFYPDEVKVKVCRTRGIVTGFDATRFVKNHKERTAPQTKLTLAQAKNTLKEGVEVETSALAVVKTARGERAAYEFVCSYKEEKYLIYTDAMTGEEISIVNVKSLG